MNRPHLKAWILTSSFVGALLCSQPISAQVIPDATLPAGERSQVSGNATVQINGGAQRGGNLFHSFSQFSVPTSGSAYFNNAADVRNIFSRVTSGSVSNIDGLIRANGTANLFLLNPNGILLGPNASLNVGGSFVATTANSITFADNFQYSATNPEASPLLTISVPIGLQMGANPEPIVVQGNGYNLSVTTPIFTPLIRGNSQTGLKVAAGQTLALIGGDIEIQGGVLTAEQGRIELSSVRDGQVNLDTGVAFSYPKVQNFGNIRLSQQALADASGGGSIQVQGNQVSLVDGSIMLIQNQGTQARGSIRVNAAQLLELRGSSPGGETYGGLTAETAGVGRGADIIVSTQQLIAQGGAGTVARSYNSGEAGNVTVTASDSIQLIGFSPINSSLSSVIGNGSFNSGAGGTITVSTGRLSLLDGGTVANIAFASGKGGAVTVNATEAVEIVGVTPLFTRSNVSSNALNSGDAGAVTINTARLTLQNGGTVNTSTVATGNGSNVTINASESVEVSGTVPNSTLVVSYIGSSGVLALEPVRQVFRLPDRPSGNSGSLTINTPRLNISNGANIGVNNEGTGNAGTLQVNANSISLDRGGSITAATAFGEGGNLDLNVRDVLLLRNNSQITTSAGSNGGNLRIKAGSIVAMPTENSDIRTNSVNARGGNVTLNASGIFGIQFRPQDTPLSDITATGASSTQNGTVQLNIERFDPTPGLVQLPTTVVDSSRLIAQGCPANQSNSFVISGRGGLPPTPEQQLDDDAEWSDRSRLVVAQQANAEANGRAEIRSQEPGVKITSERRTQNSELTAFLPTPIIEATGWRLTSTGEVFLVGTTVEPTGQNPLNQPLTCQGR
jgi:filamentous hemagglutinin family protein